jgi:hypothetical protein
MRKQGVYEYCPYFSEYPLYMYVCKVSCKMSGECDIYGMFALVLSLGIC